MHVVRRVTKEHCQGHLPVRKGKDMSGAPTTISSVHQARNTGTPTGGDLYGVRILVVVSGWESQLHGEGGEVRVFQIHHEQGKA